MHVLFRAACAALVLSTASRSLLAQDQASEHLARFGVGVAPTWRGIGADSERRVGMFGEVLVRKPNTRVSPRLTLGIAHFGSPFEHEGRLCNPDGPCDYYAPRVTVASEAIGAEWRAWQLGPRAVLALSGYQVLSRPVQGPSLNDPGARRGVRNTVGIQAGTIVPVSRRIDIEVRYEWLAQPIESTRFFLPVLVRFNW
ncbi:MAG TPA: hypothetical protein DGD08_05360 [Gemmatimonas aurantiaca]|uniref:Outer membrane protein beta-barrel domain-containing protein n=2 Tax=Gemmatimonas aurantiaca TaxID=173480 RepID=C1A6J1_GEMAT|nr:hypothetical protein [Gemmatimonas aurantiaca]BAH37851.1 hypothetical protein GAU_0809 [Gemmatimonas aurantiaca T-27]HCT56627.1 hypothetical protein [Gemmatimonas aurantiaca]